MQADKVESSTRRTSRLARWVKSVAVVLLLTGMAWAAARPTTPDAFYAHPVPDGAPPGRVLKAEPFTRQVPEGAKGWRILYVTRRGDTPALASAVVVVPGPEAGPPPSDPGPDSRPGLRPVIAWAHGTTGIAEGCAPSLSAKPFDNLPDLAAVMREGWAFVGTDYPGLGTTGGHAYLVGVDAAHAVLDAVRAARQMRETNLGREFVVWGHSQGGHAALWTGIRAAEVAPELRLAGVAALAPATDLNQLLASAKSGMFGKIVSAYLIHGYARSYPDVKIEDYVSRSTRLLVDEIASRCVGGSATLFSVLETALLPADGIFAADPASGPLGARLKANTPAALIPAPVLLAQGEADDLVTPDVQKAYVAARCTAGQAIDFKSYPGRDHVSVVASDSPLANDLLLWTRDRFDGKPSASTCRP